MNESAARAERFGVPSSPTPSSSAPYYLWEVANKPVSVRLNLETVDRLEKEVVESFRSLSSRGSEVGGLLLGSVQNGTPARVSIEAYELVPCDYVRGPLYQFSEADVERFQRAAAQHTGANGLRVVGFFRSHTRKGLGLDSEDITFFTGHFREPHQIALLIRPYASKPSTGGIFLWENGSVRGEASPHEFPFRRSELEKLPQPESKAAPEKPAAPAPEPPSAAPEPSVSKPTTRAQIVPIASRREIASSSLERFERPERPMIRPELPAEQPAQPRFAEKPPLPEPAAAKPDLPSPAFTKSPAPSYPKPSAPAAETERARETERSRETDRTRETERSRETERAREELADLVLPPLERPRRSSKMIWITAGAAAALLILSGALIYPGFSHKSKPTPAAPVQGSGLSLHVERNAGDLMLTWNRDSDAIKGAARAVLAISDGDQHENVNMDLAQLRNGSIQYVPSGNDVSFQLSIIGQNSQQTSSELVRVLKTRPSPLADATPATPQKEKPAPAARTDEKAANNSSNTAAPVANANSTAEPAPVAESRPKTKQFHAESLAQRLRPTRAEDLPEAPGLVASAAPAPLPVAVPGLNSTPGIPGVPAPPPAPRTAASAPASSAASPTAGGRLQQAQLISSKAPEYPLVAKQAHVQGVVVVSATVGVDGRVKSATAVSGPPLLQKAAVDAVKQWTYKPTTLNGAPVESETRVEVKFTASR